MIRHIVLLRLPDSYDADERDSIMRELNSLQKSIEGFEAFEHGPNLDFENKLPDHPYGFVCSFRDTEAVKVYAADENHAKLGERLIALCGGSAGILVIDLEV